MQDNKYDVCVIGSGPGGFAAAMRAFDFGKRVVIIEAGNIGGAGIMHGAMTSKTLWELSKDYAGAAAVDRGYRAASLSVDYTLVRDTVIEAAKEKQYQILSQIETFTPPRWPGPGSITLKKGWASFLDGKSVKIDMLDGTQETVKADFFVIATGSKPRDFPGITVDHKRVLSSDDVLSLKEFPKRFLIIGAGVLGCEYATIFSNFHQTKVHLLDRQARILPGEDEDISDFVNTNLTARGVEVHHNALLRKIIHHDDFLEVVVDYEGGRTMVLEVDVALVSVGRVPNLEKLGLENVGIKINARGALDTDADCRVKGNIFAVGDVTQHSALYNVAEMEGRYAVKAMYLRNKYPLRYSNMSTIMFFNPEVAAVGLNETQCRTNHIPYQLAYYSNALLNRAIAMRRTDGFVKILVSDDGQDRILGMRAAGPQASNTIMVIAHLMDQDKGVTDIMKSIHPHPSITEGIQECLRLLVNKSLFKPEVFPQAMKIRKWKPE
ncbi:MAG: NAD(P)/FAD-dependent oxidoreductase [Fibrobacterota bacterium]|nr:NAD(P)/FAD-dependent oxidoreductase [Fibrobacterota bacterium]